MAKARSKSVDYLVYFMIRLTVCVVQALSFESACGLARILAGIAYRIDRRHREVARENLQHAFPGYSEARIDAIIRGVYCHFLTLIVEIVHLPRKLRVNTWKKYMVLQNKELIVGELLAGRAVMIVTGHFGNWEMSGYLLGANGFQTFAIARALDNPYLDRFLLRFRQGTGQIILDKNRDFERIVQVLEDKGTLATLADQDAGQRGEFVQFFGRPASTHKAVALLALRHQATLLVAGARRVGEPMLYELEVADVIRPEEYAGQPDAVNRITQRFSTALEGLIRKAPEQYLWLHRRWKHQPRERRARSVA
ncbi:MAG: lysophospholipid acyltransferase family protein [Gemmataceae bacterium]